MTNKQLIPICSTKAIMPQNETENMESTDETQNLLEINEESSHNQSKASHYNVSLMEELRDAKEQEEPENEYIKEKYFLDHSTMKNTSEKKA
ncbi:hypothetical protein JTB14_014769 [Gonioctena quinquepunctata]|nr:hypothetical protein JTB14_014769 [Gonioctena quinquepunctata]